MGLLNVGKSNPFDSYNELGNKCKSDFVNRCIEDMSPYLSGQALLDLNRVLNRLLEDYELFVDNHIESNENYQEINDNFLELFIKSKELEGLSKKTLKIYEDTCRKFLDYIIKPIPNITSEDVRGWLSDYYNTHKISSTTMDNMRRFLNSFFTWLDIEGYIITNPMKKIKRFKVEFKKKKAFTDMEIETLRHYLHTTNKFESEKLRIRNLAIFELLLSSGIRVGELSKLSKIDMDLNNKSFVVTGKGNKQRTCYMSDSAKFYILKYWSFREDNDNAVFLAGRVKKSKNFNPVSHSGIERMIRNCGVNTGIENVHPHRFRRTFATNLAKKGMPIEQIQMLMGHTDISTTTIYTAIDEDDLKYNHQKYQ